MNYKENKSELVSIIVPTYNCKKYVKTTIDSILKQTYRNFEIIIIDDCSSDGTVDYILSLKDNRIVLLINDKQSGAAFSRNRGIAAARGDYIAFLDGDDIWYETKLEEQMLFMKTNGYFFSCTDYDVVNENGLPQKIVVSGPKIANHKMFLKTDYIGCLTVMYKRDIYPDLAIPDTIYKRNDYALWIKLSEKAKCFRLKKVLASYRRTSSSLSSGKKSKLVKYHKEMFEKLYNFGKIKSTYYALRNVFYYFYRRIKYFKKVKTL